MLAQAPRGCDHEHRPAERGWIRDPRAREPAELLEEVRFGGNRAAQHEDPTDDSSLSHPARRTPLSRGPVAPLTACHVAVEPDFPGVNLDFPGVNLDFPGGDLDFPGVDLDFSGVDPRD
jgi:hypothetical protein